ncbi:type I-E CRISPR-associated endoribonuclease Cas2e [Actinocorallia sp. A-T 12471]|uniref:type I-E CRISPR-associated endoribonuclease Cas2e n=1 Tax=Actinocorallia sp. A-T 12471 TaxID=3089813 RepID=UPI0029D1EFBC|nr:type I-E CRISPR-associated endoribonuclease Cas2e [Actinocorallia sp. A-T 12471]MDX6740996.1 type I-E CRISPR-associated endoribonuclease Cas2e [Actinocorallia sp. A-T 12471]
MTVIILTNCPSGLRGFLTRWLLEISPGVFLGAPSARVRDLLWSEVCQYTGQGRALLAYQTNTEQGFAFETHDHSWHPTDHEGLTLLRRPNPNTPPPPSPAGAKPPNAAATAPANPPPKPTQQTNPKMTDNQQVTKNTPSTT